MKKFSIGKKLIAMLGIALMFLQYMVVPQYATVEEIEAENKIGAGNGHSAWIDEQGRLWMWGSNTYGQLGNGTLEDEELPILIKEDTKFNQVSLGDNFSGAIDENGNLWMWGSNSYGQLGNGSTEDSIIPVNISELMDGKKFVNLSLGGESSAAIDDEGRLYTWGSNLYGELGNGTTIDSEIPIQIMTDEDITFVQVNSGKSFKSAIDESGKIWMWGSNVYGQIGNGEYDDAIEPTLILPEKMFKKVSLGKDTAAAIDVDGNLYAWGENTFGQVGDGTTDDAYEPVQIMNGTKFISVGIGKLHSVAIDEEGNLYTWGLNEEYQLGNESTQDSSVPIKLETNARFIEVVSGDAHTVVLDEDKDVWTWGNNNYHQLGYDGEGHKPIPITKRKVTFKNYDGTILLEKWVKYGSNAVYDGATPQKIVTGYNYSFTGWDKSLDNITTNLVCIAQFEETQVTHELIVNPGDEKHTGDIGSTEKITAPEVTIIYNYNGSGQQNQEIKAQFNRWTLEKTNGLTASGKITNVIVNPVTYTYGDGDDTLTACYRPIILQTPQREGYEFSGWYAHETCQEINKVGNGGVVYTPRSNVTLYAKWTKIEVKENLYLSSDKYKFKMSENEDEKSYLYRINPDTTLTELLYYLDTNGEITVYNKAGNPIGPNDIIGTGMTLVDVGYDRTITLTLSVKGDTDGNGQVSATDLATMKQVLLKEYEFNDERYISLDISDDEKVTATDLAAMKQVLLKELNLASID